MPLKGLTERSLTGMRAALGEGRHGLSATLLFAGPAVVTSIAYIDPGNFATNIQAGARFGYDLLWIVLLSNLMAMLFQALSAKLGIVTGRNLAEMCRDHFPLPMTIVLWIVSELAAMATDLAEFVGGAIGISLLLHLPLLLGMAITAVATFGMLMLQQHGFRPMEIAIGGLVAVISLCFLVEIALAPVDWGQVLYHSVRPSMKNTEALTIAVGIIGATVMPHAVYLHSGLAQERFQTRDIAECRAVLRFSNREVVAALSLAGLVNMAMVVMASAVFHAGHADVDQIGTAYKILKPILGNAAASVFLVSLIASGLSSSTVGTMAGQMIMQGFVGVHIPVTLRRLVTILPSFVVIAAGVDATRALVLSQVVLSFALPVPIIALVLFTSRRAIMGPFTNSRLTILTAISGAGLILTLNAVLILQTLGLLPK